MVQVEFLTFQNQVMNKRANALQKKKYKKYKKKIQTFAQVIWVCKQTILNVSLKTILK